MDEEAANYVRKIFELACNGYSTGKIAIKLNEEHIPTPGQYKNRERIQYHILDDEGYWNRKMVLKILENKVYLGVVVNVIRRLFLSASFSKDADKTAYLNIQISCRKPPAPCAGRYIP